MVVIFLWFCFCFFLPVPRRVQSMNHINPWFRVPPTEYTGLRVPADKKVGADKTDRRICAELPEEKQSHLPTYCTAVHIYLSCEFKLQQNNVLCGLFERIFFHRRQLIKGTHYPIRVFLIHRRVSCNSLQQLDFFNS